MLTICLSVIDFRNLLFHDLLTIFTYILICLNLERMIMFILGTSLILFLYDFIIFLIRLFILLLIEEIHMNTN